MEYNVLHEEIDVVNPRFRFHSAGRKYQLLIMYGHSAVRELMVSIKNKSLMRYRSLREGDKLIEEIVDDFEALYMLNKAASLSPSIKFIKSSEDSGYLGEMIICYTRNYATFE
ncbi:hypothetical protein HYW75_04725 [Candidatus Pacearchaeota archaeon]|nr:hypothetical protein [Candidatus Pacearchaeota archaeon]